MVVGSRLLLCIILLFQESSSQLALNNSSVPPNLITFQCVTREEVQREIQAQTDHLGVDLLRNEVQSLASLLQGLFQVGSYQNPAESCRVLQGASSSYWIQPATSDSPVQVFCDMTRRCCNTTGGWMQVANLDMTDTNQHCPSGFNQITSPRRLCGRHSSGCVSATFPVHGVGYSRVCGRVTGYQRGTPDAFQPYSVRRFRTIDSTYVDGVSVTHGHSPRKHIWTFTAAGDQHGFWRGQCTVNNGRNIPPFVGDDYFCDSGNHDDGYSLTTYYLHDPLWNGQGCIANSNFCSFNNPPWFCKQLSQATTDDIEVRICADSGIADEDVLVEAVEVYVQ